MNGIFAIVNAVGVGFSFQIVEHNPVLGVVLVCINAGLMTYNVAKMMEAL